MTAIFLVAACSSVQGLPEASPWGVSDTHPEPPPTVITLEGPPFATVRERYQLVISGALETERAVLVVGPEAGEGPCIRRLGGYCLDIGEPVSRYSEALVGGEGRGLFDLTAPPWADTEYCFQAIIPRGPSGISSAFSNVLCVNFCAAEDADGDTICDAFDACPGGDDRRDVDEDGICDMLDLCPTEFGEPDEDGDGICDLDDVCPGGVDSDTDGDGTLDGCAAAAMEHEVRWGDFVYAAIDDIPVDAVYGEFSTCQTTPLPIPEGWEIAPYEAGIESFIFEHGWSTHCMITSDGCSQGTFNYGFGTCGCDVLTSDGVNYWASSCSRRVLIRRPG